MELQVSKRCHTCGYIEILSQAGIASPVAINLTAIDNLVCRHCSNRTISLDSKVINVPWLLRNDETTE